MHPIVSDTTGIDTATLLILLGGMGGAVATVSSLFYKYLMDDRKECRQEVKDLREIVRGYQETAPRVTAIAQQKLSPPPPRPIPARRPSARKKLGGGSNA